MDYPDRGIAALIDCAEQVVPVGLIGAVLGYFLGTFAYKRSHQTQEKNDEERNET